MMALPLVVGVDGSDGSLRAIDWAVDEAQRRGLSLRLVYASLWERYEGALPTAGRERPSEQVMAENIVGTAAERVRRYEKPAPVAATRLHGHDGRHRSRDDLFDRQRVRRARTRLEPLGRRRGEWIGNDGGRSVRFPR